MDKIVGAIRGNPNLRRLLWKGKFGLEIERLRVDSDGKLALTPHPAGLGNKAEHPFITTDFSESQLELVTPPLDSVEEAYGFVKTLHNIVRAELVPGELLWSQSMPPVLPAEEEIPLARFDGDASGRTEYRRYLSEVYGRARQTISGGHFNVSFPEEFFRILSDETGLLVSEVKERVYLRIVRNLIRHRWFLVGLLGRSPVAHESLRLKALDSDAELEIVCEYGMSIRCSQIGYRNREPLWVDYSSVENYNADLRWYVEEGRLLNPNELYLPVRIKQLPGEEEISHIEIRVIDLDPFDPVGVSMESLRVTHLFLLHALLMEEGGELGHAEQERADELQNRIACWGYVGKGDCDEMEAPVFPFRERTIGILEEMERDLALGEEEIPAGYREAVGYFRRFAEEPEKHPASRIRRQVAEEGFISFHLRRAREQVEELSADVFRFHAFPDLELSTQLLLKAAVRRGISFDLLDRKQNFVRLKKRAKTELVVQATKTSLDRYSSILAMENKKVTKQLLAENGISVPGGSGFYSAEEAKFSWSRFRGNPVVIKPVNTNFGIGISILKENEDKTAFEEAIDGAFAEDGQILIETWIPGKEYRFFLINHQVLAILHRVPANVVGDGRSTIRELVERKNSDPFRGKGYVTPLEKIGMGAAEELVLRMGNRTFETVPALGEQVFLRENSNISTGGDSIDFTDRTHSGYLEIASAASRALGVQITGLDMIVSDISAPPNPENHAIIEMNFNPAIHMHCYPYQGESRPLAEHLLSALGFL